MAAEKKLTDRFLVALFKRGKAEYLPVSYLQAEGEKVLAAGESNNLLNMLTDMKNKGIIEEQSGEYKLLIDPFA